MNEQEGKVALPVFGDREYNALFEKHTMELSDVIVDAITVWLTGYKGKPEKERPSAMAVGAACYVALWKMSESANDDSLQDAMRYSCATTLLKNDTKFQLAIADLPPLAN